MLRLRAANGGDESVIVMLDTPQSLDVAEQELGMHVEQLLTPLTRRTPQRSNDWFAIDNGAFSNFNAKEFLSLLKRELPRRGLCRFVAVPDVVGSALRTSEVFEFWSPALQEWPIAFVCQDGQETLPIPWTRIVAIFIGGSTEWKMGRHAEACIKAGKATGKWVHVGRVNTPGRFEHFERMGVDSIDGTGLAQYSHMREAIRLGRENPKLNIFRSLPEPTEKKP